MKELSVDGGSGYLKICLSLFDVTSLTSNSEKGFVKKFKETGVKKVITDVNLKKLWLTIRLNSSKRSFTIATGLKLCNILLGLVSHSSTYPCCSCDIDMHNLNKEKQRTFAYVSDLFWT